MKTAALIRSHIFGDAEKKIFALLESYFGKKNTFLALQESTDTAAVPQNYNLMTVGPSSLESLYFHPQWGWRCGDYWYYACYKWLKDFDYIWMIEPDVYFANPDIKSFFVQFENSADAFIAPGFGKAGDKLPFYHTGKHLEGITMSCLFSLTRIKTDQIPFLYRERQALSETFQSKKFSDLERRRNFPNDEIFVSTTLVQRKQNVSNIDAISSFDFRLFSADERNAFVLDQAESLKGNFIIHPVLSKEKYIEKKCRILIQKLNANQAVGPWLRSTLNKQSNEAIRNDLKKALINTFTASLQ